MFGVMGSCTTIKFERFSGDQRQGRECSWECGESMQMSILLLLLALVQYSLAPFPDKTGFDFPFEKKEKSKQNTIISPDF